MSETKEKFLSFMHTVEGDKIFRAQKRDLGQYEDGIKHISGRDDYWLKEFCHTGPWILILTGEYPQTIIFNNAYEAAVSFDSFVLEHDLEVEDPVWKYLPGSDGWNEDYSKSAQQVITEGKASKGDIHLSLQKGHVSENRVIRKSDWNIDELSEYLAEKCPDRTGVRGARKWIKKNTTDEYGQRRTRREMLCAFARHLARVH